MAGPPSLVHAAAAETGYHQVGTLPGETTDEDSDGVADIDDNCPHTSAQTGTPRGAVPTRIDACGCAIDPCREDLDRDGVGDCIDDCPGTFLGHIVKADGCPAPLTQSARVRLDVKFAFDRAEIDPGFATDLLKLRETLLRYPEIRVRLEGHTDWMGSDAYNQRLSEARANATRDFILQEPGIDPARVEAIGFGEAQPVASNETEEGRAQNRRTVADVRFDRTILPANDAPPPLGGFAPETEPAAPSSDEGR